jgi:hypothetical protein
MIELQDVWVFRDGGMLAEGDASRINELLARSLTKVTIDPVSGGWRILYRHEETGRFWELDHPQGEMHGGGPRRLRELDLVDPVTWA